MRFGRNHTRRSSEIHLSRFTDSRFYVQQNTGAAGLLDLQHLHEVVAEDRDPDRRSMSPGVART